MQQLWPKLIKVTTKQPSRLTIIKIFQLKTSKFNLASEKSHRFQAIFGSILIFNVNGYRFQHILVMRSVYSIPIRCIKISCCTNLGLFMIVAASLHSQRVWPLAWNWAVKKLACLFCSSFIFHVTANTTRVSCLYCNEIELLWMA